MDTAEKTPCSSWEMHKIHNFISSTLPLRTFFMLKKNIAYTSQTYKNINMNMIMIIDKSKAF